MEWLRKKVGQLQQALDEAKQAGSALKVRHDALQKQVSAEAPSKQAIAQQAKSQVDAAPVSGGNSAESTAAAITSLHHIAVDQKDLADLDKRIQDQEDLATAYGNWIDIVKVRQQAVLHDMIQAAMLMLAGGVCGLSRQPAGGSFLCRTVGGTHPAAHAAQRDSTFGAGGWGAGGLYHSCLVYPISFPPSSAWPPRD